ncbi:Elongation of very long chain fatty acids protein, partial [Trichostrongylus colubriformis]
HGTIAQLRAAASAASRVASRRRGAGASVFGGVASSRLVGERHFFAMSSHAVWSGNGHTILYAPFTYKSIVGPEHFWNPDKVHAFFAQHWSSSIYLALGYVVIINVMQRVMENRKPLSMKSVLLVWNGMLAVFSMMGTWRFGLEFYNMLTTRPFTDSVCFSVDPTGPASFWACMFAFSKIAELGDTLFLVLRKRPVIFLHWYHHAVVLVYCWHSAVELTAAGRWFIWMNYFVHSIMYTYYAIVSTGIRLPKRLSMTVTALQTTQMLIGVVISVYVLYLKLNGAVCQQSFDNLAICFAIYASFLILFSKFFNTAYLVKREKITTRKSTEKAE